MKMILLGAPGAGKGTLAAVLNKKLGIPTISTGNIIREAMHSGTEMGQKAKAFVEEGKLVPDEVVIGIIRDRLAQDDCKNGYILDGFPRTIPQAQALRDMGIDMDLVVEIAISDERIVSRMSGRRVCSKCGASYHIVNIPPKQEGICDDCGSELMIRKDDDPKTVLDRIQVYHEQTEPLKGFYEQLGVLRTVDGDRNGVDETVADIMKLIEATV